MYLVNCVYLFTSILNQRMRNIDNMLVITFLLCETVQLLLLLYWFYFFQYECQRKTSMDFKCSKGVGKLIRVKENS